MSFEQDFDADGFFGEVRYSLTLDVSKTDYAGLSIYLKDYSVQLLLKPKNNFPLGHSTVVLSFNQFLPHFLSLFQSQAFAKNAWVVDPLDAGEITATAQYSHLSYIIHVVFKVKRASYNPSGTFNSNGEKIGESPYRMPQTLPDFDHNEILFQLKQ